MEEPKTWEASTTSTESSDDNGMPSSGGM
jgi:hypothetical protein